MTPEPTKLSMPADLSILYECRAGSMPPPHYYEYSIRIGPGLQGEVVVAELLEKLDGNKNIGYDANTGEYVDMFKAGILDPTKVTRSALINAASISGLMLTTDVLVTKIDEEDKKSKVTGSVA